MNRHTIDTIEANLDARPLPETGKPGPRTWLDVAKERAVANGVDHRDVLSRRRFKAMAIARHQSWIILRGYGYSFPEIAAGWGVEHTSVVYGCGARRRGRGRAAAARFPVRIVVVRMFGSRYELRLMRGGEKLRVLGVCAASGRWLLDANHAWSLRRILPPLDRCSRKKEAA